MVQQVFKAAILGAVQGLTEFLPVSSSGHLVLLENFMKVSFDELSFNILVHLATLLAVLIFTSGTLVDILKGAYGEFKRKKIGENIADLFYLVLATVITVAVALCIGDKEEILTSPYIASVGFLFTSVLLLFLWLLGSGRIRSYSYFKERMNLKSSLIAGFLQGVAAIPGVSRSGSTIFGLVASGIKPERAVRYSFLLSIPVIAGAGVFEYMKTGFAGIPIGVGIAGFVSAFVFSFLALNILVKVALKNLWVYFGVYTFALGLGSLFLKYLSAVALGR